MKISFETGNGDDKKKQPPDQATATKKEEITPTAGQDLSSILKSMNAKVICIFYIFFENIPVEVARKTIKATQKEFRFAGGKYIVQGYKPFMIKPMFYWLTKNYQPILEYKLGDSIPLSLHKSDLEVDANNLNRITNELNIKTLLPNANQTMQMITLIALAIAAGGVFLSFYLIADPEGRDKLIDLATNAKPTPKPSTNSTNPGPVIITPK